MKKRLLPLLTVLLIATASANALVLLPDSSMWQGYTEDTEYNAFIEYAVYDKLGDDLVGYDDIANVGEGQYVYAYQIFTTENTSDIDSFKVMGFDTSNITGTGTIDDQNPNGTAVDADGIDTDSLSISWLFESVELANGVRSYFLAYSSDASPIAGNYEITTIEDDNGDPLPVPDQENEIPEPATVALLALGIAPAIAKRKKN